MRNGLIGLTTAVWLASTMAAAGCSSSSSGGGTGGKSGNSGGTGGGTGGGSVTSLSGSKALNTLTTSEATQLCNDTFAYFGSAIPRAAACKWKGLSYAASSSAPSQSVLQQNCTSQETGCLQADAGAGSNLGCGDIPASCTVTVAQYAACIGAEVAAFTQTVGGLPSCTALTSADTSAIFEAQSGGTPPASCAPLGDICPALSLPTPLN